jgi:hypothetical protein
MVANVFKFPVSHPSLSNHSYKGPFTLESVLGPERKSGQLGSPTAVAPTYLAHQLLFCLWSRSCRETVLIPKSCQDWNGHLWRLRVWWGGGWVAGMAKAVSSKSGPWSTEAFLHTKLLLLLLDEVSCLSLKRPEAFFGLLHCICCQPKPSFLKVAS